MCFRDRHVMITGQILLVNISINKIIISLNLISEFDLFLVILINAVIQFYSKIAICRIR